MAQRTLTKEQCKQAIDAVNAALRDGYRLDSSPSAIKEAAKRLGINPGTFQHRFNSAPRFGLKPNLNLQKDLEVPQKGETVVSRLEEENKTLKLELKNLRREELARENIRRHIFELAALKANPPDWVSKSPKGAGKSTGTPTLFLSDWHAGEIVRPDEIGGVNEFNLDIAHKRIQRLVEKALMLLFDHLSNPSYDGLVLPIGGDMLSGDIHEELTITNELPVLPTVMDLFGSLVWVIDELLKHFKRVFAPCVTGNHGRHTKKIQSKERWATSFDWLLYAMLEKHYAKDDRVTILAAHSSDVLYRVYSHKFLLTHGDQFRGGDGMVGALGPILRGDHKKRSRNAQIDMEYDTMLIGHWHQYIHLTRLIVNGSLKGYDEYAYQSNFGYEPPQQALWVNHPKHGITYRMPVHLDEPVGKSDSDWVSLPKVA